jgi:hypothetical protein
MFVGKVETQPIPSFFRILTRPFAAFTFIEEASNMNVEKVDKTHSSYDWRSLQSTENALRGDNACV